VRPADAVRVVVAVAVLAQTGAASATGLEQLRAFVAGAKSGTAVFRQVVVGKGQRSAREASGTFTFLRPGKFRWAYTEPYEQLVVGDGAKLDLRPRLNQVIVRSRSRARPEPGRAPRR
jgi:outer membrane lipoprotein carrier protein